METIKEIFNHKLFRIPDYQRGYSWELTHLEDFWKDLTNLQQHKIHYTGMISVEEVEKDEYSNWQNDQWIIEGRKDKPYFVVDGQQRLTTIIILLWVIISSINEEDELGFESRKSIINKYIFSENPKQNFKSYIFGYHKDNPSYEFLKKEVFEQNDLDISEQPEETAYTNNLLNAKKFFVGKIKRMSLDHKDRLYDKITNQLKFDFKILEKELDIFIVFETMNNRGKPLSNLEKLKNRLIYLSTLLNDEDQRKKQLRDEINDHWKIVYKYLGLNKDKRLDDDAFLQNHWIMYWRYERREPEFYATDIFDRVFTSDLVINSRIGFDDIQSYIKSMSEGVTKWFIMYNPSHVHALELTQSPTLLSWLKKLNRLGYKAFAPLIMAGMIVAENSPSSIIELVKAVESYIFLIFNVSFRRSNTGSYHFNTKANELFDGQLSIEAIIADINYWIHGDEEYHGYYDIGNFQNFLNDFFLRDTSNGFLDWKYLRYFLYEYEIFLNGSEEGMLWKDFTEVVPIYPKSPVQTCWKHSFDQYRSTQKFRLFGTIGNFVLSKYKLVGEREECFYEIQNSLDKNLLNQVEVADFSDWTPDSILKRGLKILQFLEERWSVTIGDMEAKKRLLFLEFLSE